MAEGLERVRISASELRGILTTLAPQAGSRGESRRPAPGPGLPAPPPSPFPPPRLVRGASEPPPLPSAVGAGAEGGPFAALPAPGPVWGPAQPAWPPSGDPNPNPCLLFLPLQSGSPTGGCTLGVVTSSGATAITQLHMVSVSVLSLPVQSHLFVQIYPPSDVSTGSLRCICVLRRESFVEL